MIVHLKHRVTLSVRPRLNLYRQILLVAEATFIDRTIMIEGHCIQILKGQILRRWGGGTQRGNHLLDK